VSRYARVRGWLEIDHAHRAGAEEVIRRHRHELYTGGWAFPAAPFNWTLYLFYGGDIRADELPWLRAQLIELAALEPIDEDNDRPEGVFLVSVESDGPPVLWQIRDGGIAEEETPALSWLDD